MPTYQIMKTFVASVILAFVAAPVVAQDCVVMLHGLARTEISMTAMALVLEGEGYRVVNRGYPSTESTIPNLVADHVTEDVAACALLAINLPPRAIIEDLVVRPR